MANLFFLYEQKFNVHHSIEISLKISTNKLQGRIQSDWYQITRPYPMWLYEHDLLKLRPNNRSNMLEMR
jgi:hypothetical protein